MNTIIGKGAKVEGSLEVNGALRIDGYVKGKLYSTEVLTVGKDGIVEADMECKVAIIGGSVKGNVVASEKIELQTKSSVQGDLTTKSIMVEQGAVFQGKCTMPQMEKMINVDNLKSLTH